MTQTEIKNKVPTGRLAQKMFDLITENVKDSLVRAELFDILDELENRI